METISDPGVIQSVIAQERAHMKTIGFVPTMGSLHFGHMTLIEQARKECDFVVVSIFVNPTQFGPDEDFEKYPRSINRDLELCENAQVDIVFTPNVKDMYPQGNDELVISFPEISKKLCGKFRPGHFDGVTTIMSKFLSIIAADKCFMGKKDAQQLIIIQKMAKDMFLNTEIVGCETVREDTGLAMSSRNEYLSEEGKEKASLIYTSLSNFKDNLVESVEKANIEQLLEEQIAILEKNDFEVQYFDFVDRNNLDPARKLSFGRYLL